MIDEAWVGIGLVVHIDEDLGKCFASPNFVSYAVFLFHGGEERPVQL